MGRVGGDDMTVTGLGIQIVIEHLTVILPPWPVIPWDAILARF